MSNPELRLTAAALQYKYARVFNVPRAWVLVEFFKHKKTEKEDARIYHALYHKLNLPVWFACDDRTEALEQKASSLQQALDKLW